MKFEYIGVIHVHSEFSDGTGKVDEIAQIADEVGLDYLILTDHNTLRALREGYEKWYGNSLLLVGVEINDKENKNHYLAMGVNETFSTRMSAEEYVRKVKEKGGIGFIAHPHEKRNRMPEHPPFPWTAWNAEDFTGIEIWNHMSEWMEGLTEENKYQRVVHPLRSIVAPPRETLAKWDEIAEKRHITGIGGVDAHAHKVNVLGFFEVEIFPYKVLFQSIRTHVLLDEPLRKSRSAREIEKAKKAIYKALEKGSCFVSNFYHGDAKGFKFFAETENGTFEQGETVRLNGKIKLNIVLPAEAEIRLIKNGKQIYSVKDFSAEIEIDERGVYRAEVFKGKFGWIFSNHIRIE
jgi:hypothetical protein